MVLCSFEVFFRDNFQSIVDVDDQCVGFIWYIVLFFIVVLDLKIRDWNREE